MNQTIKAPLTKSEEKVEFYNKEIMILQQSQSKLVLDFLTANGVVPTAEVLWRTTELFVQLCLHKQTDDVKKRVKGLDKWIQEQKNPKDLEVSK
jgi:hypothetical protein